MNLNFKQLRYLCALADTGNYHTAAQKLFVTQPTLSIAIKNLEASLGTVLFVRTAREVIPTEAGKIVIAYARRILELDQEMYQKLGQLQQPPKQELRIGTYLILYALLMPTLITEFHQLHPEINLATLHCHYAALEKALLKNNLDLILCVQEEPNPLLDNIQLKKEHLLAALPPDHPACQKARLLPDLPFPYLDIRELNGDNFYIQYPHQQIRWQENKLWEIRGFQPGRIKETDSIDLSVRLASEGLGVAFTMESYLKALHVQKPIRYFITGDLKTCPWLTICVPRGHSRLPVIRDCIRLLKKEIQTLC